MEVVSLLEVIKSSTFGVEYLSFGAGWDRGHFARSNWTAWWSDPGRLPTVHTLLARSGVLAKTRSRIWFPLVGSFTNWVRWREVLNQVAHSLGYDATGCWKVQTPVDPWPIEVSAYQIGWHLFYPLFLISEWGKRRKQQRTGCLIQLASSTKVNHATRLTLCN